MNIISEILVKMRCILVFSTAERRQSRAVLLEEVLNRDFPPLIDFEHLSLYRLDPCIFAESSKLTIFEPAVFLILVNKRTQGV